jgi:peptidoglycan-associated lipoprotein
MKKRIFILAPLAVLALACGGKAQTPPQTATETTVAKPDTTPRPVSANVALSDDILRACKIEFTNQGDAPKFDYDSTNLSSDDLHVLQQVVACLTTGPLKGKSVQLVGRADPRGSDQYNMALGANRANQVEQFLHDHGVQNVSETSRGAIDATGKDESGWRKDRRVDLVLAGS